MGWPAAGMNGIDADGINCAVNANIVRKIPNCLNRVLRIEINYLRSLITGHFQSRSDCIDCEDAACAQKFGARNGELTHGSTTEDRHCRAWMYVREVGREISGGEDIGNQDCLFVRYFFGQFYRAYMCEGNPRVFSLKSIEWTAFL